MLLNPVIEATLEEAKELLIPEDRQKILRDLIGYIQKKKDAGEPVRLNFICTHNSRRSQFAQIWAQAIAAKMDLDISSYSGGVEVTAFNDNAIAAIEKAGYTVIKEDGDNPLVKVLYSSKSFPINAFSKKYDDPPNPESGFAAVMTCSHADETCPFIPGAEARIPLNYEDPKQFDGTVEEAKKYDERSKQIASEMLYVFSSGSLKRSKTA
ncbi:MAG: protein-tyrosine-phosphatase [Balneolales bacterium]